MAVEPGTVTPQEALQTRIGREVTPGVTAYLSHGLLKSMGHGALAQRALLNANLEQATTEATSAAVLLFPDGPVESDHSGKNSLRPTPETAGKHTQKIVDAFMYGDTRPLVTAFGEMVDLLDAINARGMSDLKPEFLRRTPFEITQEADRLWYKRDTRPPKIIAGLTGRWTPPDPDEMEKLDEFLQVVIQSVEGSTDHARAHIKDDSTAVDEALDNAEELLTTIMAGNVDGWI